MGSIRVLWWFYRDSFTGSRFLLRDLRGSVRVPSRDPQGFFS